jgi:hypothetical protein
MLAPLSPMPDPQLAKRFAIPLRAIKRQRLLIPAPVDRGPVLPTAMLRRLLALPSAEVRRRTGLSWQTFSDIPAAGRAAG